MADQEPIPYDDFRWETGVIDNYILFFSDGAMAEEFRKYPAFKEFARTHPDVAERLLAAIPTVLPWTKESLEPYREDLHKGYIFMRTFFEHDGDFGITRP